MPAMLGKLGGWFRTWMRQHRGSLLATVAVTFAALVIYIFAFVGENQNPVSEYVQRQELATLDLRFQIRKVANPDSQIVVVDIDQKSQEELGRWPFPRDRFAQMLDALREDGASVVAFDITFSKPDQSAAPFLAEIEKLKDPQLADRLKKQFDYDGQFAEAIRRFSQARQARGSGGIVLGNFFLYTEADLKGLSAQSLDEYADLIWEFALSQVRIVPNAKGKESRLYLVDLFMDVDLLPLGAQANMRLLQKALSGDYAATGHFNVRADADGVVRRALLVLPYGRSGDPDDADFYGSMDLQATRMFLGLKDRDVVVNVGEVGIESIQFGENLRVVPDAVGRVMINYQGPVRSYKYVSMADVVNGKFDRGIFRDKIVLVGASATGIGDLRTTPYGGLDYPGVEIHANVIDNLLNQKTLERGPRQVVADVTLILLLGIPLGLWLGLVEPRWMPLSILLIVPLGGLWYYTFTQGAWLNVIVPLATLLSNTGLVALWRVFFEEKEKRKVRGAFQQYLSPEVIRRLLNSPELVQPRKVEISVMFSDIRGFTSISEQLDAQELALFLNDYLTDMTRIVFNNRGTLDKYIGDAVMAFWGAPFEETDHPQKACRSALEMMDRLHEMQKEWEAGGKPKLDIGLGINSGVASVGNMGSALRYGYTAMGDAVNLASRLEGLNKEYGTHIIVSESTFAGADTPEFLFRAIDLIRVKGKLQPVMIYELMGRRDSNAEMQELATLFAQGRALYQQRQWREAQEVFEEILNRWDGDGPTRTYWKRCQEYLFEEPPPSWDGVFIMTHK